MAVPVRGNGPAEGHLAVTATGALPVAEVTNDMDRIKGHLFRAVVFGSFVLMLAAPTRWLSLFSS